MNEVIFGQLWHLYSTNRLTDWWHMPSVCVRQRCLMSNQACFCSLCKLTLKYMHITKKSISHNALCKSSSTLLNWTYILNYHMCDANATLHRTGTWYNDPLIRDGDLDGCCKSCDFKLSEMCKGNWTIYILYVWLKCSICLPNLFTGKYRGIYRVNITPTAFLLSHCGVSYAGRAWRPHCCLPLTSDGSVMLCV